MCYKISKKSTFKKFKHLKKRTDLVKYFPNFNIRIKQHILTIDTHFKSLISTEYIKQPITHFLTLN